MSNNLYKAKQNSAYTKTSAYKSEQATQSAVKKEYNEAYNVGFNLMRNFVVKGNTIYTAYEVVYDLIINSYDATPNQKAGMAAGAKDYLDAYRY